jgi:hypothetical protein
VLKIIIDLYAPIKKFFFYNNKMNPLIMNLIKKLADRKDCSNLSGKYKQKGVMASLIEFYASNTIEQFPEN